MSQTTAEEPTELSFEQGYERLQAIANRLNEDAVPVSEMCDLFAEGKGLELALTEFLDTQRERVETIERGEGIRTFRISRAPASPAPDPAHMQNAASEDDFRADDDFVPTPHPAPPARPHPASSRRPSASEDDIPF